MLRRNSTILCVDEDPGRLVEIKGWLKLNGRCVLIATSPRRGLEILASQQVDGVILDDYLLPIHVPQAGNHRVWLSRTGLLAPTPSDA